MLTSLLDVIQFNRWNKAVVPDWVFMLGKASLQNTCAMLTFMPSTILVSRLCPSGIEVERESLILTVFLRILSGYKNLLIIKFNNGSCNFNYFSRPISLKLAY